MPRYFPPIADRLKNLAIPEPNTGCWLWTGYVNQSGYGMATMRRPKRSVLVHRLSYETFVGPIMEWLQIDHRCRTRICINPDHLEPVTGRENLQRADKWPGNKTHCKHGHSLLLGQNLHFYKHYRVCLTCRRQRIYKRPERSQCD